VEDTAHHPAVFAYGVGSEFGGDPNCASNGGDVRNCQYWKDFNTIASTIRQAMGSNRKLITTATYQSSCSNPKLCSPTVPCIGHVINGEHAGADVDFWGVDVYSPNPGAAYLRQNIFKATTKPFFMPEYGETYQPTLPGSSQDKSRQEYALVQEVEQFSYEDGKDGNEVGEFDQASPVYSGGLLFEWNDEYWKAPTGSPPCAPASSSAQGWYGKNALRLKPGCPCVSPEQRTAACAMDDLEPRPLLSDPTLLGSLWNTYTPSSYAQSPSIPGTTVAPTPSPSSWRPCGPHSKVCCNPHTTPRQFCPDGRTECQECGGGSACECPEVAFNLTSSFVV